MRENDASLSKKLHDLELSVSKSVDFAIATAKEALEISSASKKIIDNLKSEIELLKKSFLKSDKAQDKINDSLVKQELYSRKRNLIFTAFDNIQLECSVVVKQISNILNLDGVTFEQAHLLLHDKKQFIVRFNSLSDRDRI